MAILNINSRHMAFSDSDSVTANPNKRYFDFLSNFNGIKVSRPESDEGVIPPSGTASLFSGTRTLSIDGTTTFDLSLSIAQPSVYRLAVTAGTVAGFRTTRALTMNAEQITVSVNNNATADFALQSVSAQSFASVQVGDVLFVPGTSTGDAASPFSALNEGFWTVLAVGPVSAVANKKVTVKRLNNQSFQAEAEVVTLTANSQLVAFSSGPVQVGDWMRISAGFSQVSRRTYQITQVTDSWVEFFSSEPLPLQSGILPGASGVAIYSEARNFIRVEVDQDAEIRVNGASVGVPLTAQSPGNPDGPGWFDVWGVFWDVVLINQNTGEPLNYKLLTATKSV